MLFAISNLHIKRGTQVFLVGIDSLPKCYSGKHFLSPRAQIALLFGPTTTVTILSLNCGKPSEDGGVKQDTTAGGCNPKMKHLVLTG